MDSVNVTQIVAYVEEDPVLGLVLFSVGNVLATSICPFPLGVVGCVIAGVLYGAVLGAVIYVLTCSTGAWITFVLFFAGTFTECVRSQTSIDPSLVEPTRPASSSHRLHDATRRCVVL